MNVDHIVPRKVAPDLALDIRNLQLLCPNCNNGKGNKDHVDFRTEKQKQIAREYARLLRKEAA
jgi:5-methylcytosine-specific restriction endonuclease McrA